MTNKEQLQYYIQGQKFMRKTIGKLDKVIMQEIRILFNLRRV